jgi:SAM-dependent methyltransferase
MIKDGLKGTHHNIGIELEGDPMHYDSMLQMKLCVSKYLRNLRVGATVVDIGAADINGCYRIIFEPKFKYIGFDLENARNVDYLMVSEFNTGFPSESADVVISGQVLEHCRNPFSLAKEMFRIAKPNAYLFLTAPHTWPYHRVPLDCWRILPDGMETLMEQTGWKMIDIFTVDRNTWGIGRRKKSMEKK